jgi:class 3 adenylate cyclase/tetratricopeptide (TPR) repeat protein
LGEELGIEPSRELTRLEQAILLQVPDLDWRPRSIVSTIELNSIEYSGTLPTGVVTFMLTDVVGSTELWERHPRAMADAIASHSQIISNAIEAHDGRLLKARGEGDSTFSVFHRATDALDAASETRDALALFLWPDEINLRVRIALHTGEAIEADGDYYGTTVNRAARLRELATGHDIVLSQTTAELVADHLEDKRLVALGEHQLRGLQRGEHIYSVASDLRESVTALHTYKSGRRIPLPTSLVFDDVFVGRAGPLMKLEEALRYVKDGQPQPMFIAGEPGVGKTRLVAECAKRAHREGAIVLYGRCDDELGVAFQPFIEALRHWMRFASPRIESIHRESLSELSRLLPEITSVVAGLRPPRQLDPDRQRYELFQAIQSALAAISNDAPVLLVLDDLHWATKPTLLLLRHLLRVNDPVPLMVLGTYRDTELAPTSPLGDMISELRSVARMRHLALGGLTANEIVEYLDARGVLDRDGRADLAQQLWIDTDGLPLFVRELVEHESEDDMSASDAGVPSRLRDMIERRTAHLARPSRDLVAAAAVAGPIVSIGLLERACALDDIIFLDAIEEAMRAGIFAADRSVGGNLAFSHGLVRNAIYNTLNSVRRAHLHLRLAQSLEGFGPVGDDDERLPGLAYHFARAADMGRVEDAAEYALRAGKHAIACLAFEDAVEFLEEALRIVDRQPSRDALAAKLSLLLSEAYFALRDLVSGRGAARRAADAARRLGDADVLARAALLYAGNVMWGNRDPNAVQLLLDALDALPASANHIRAHVLAELAEVESTFNDLDDAENHAVLALEAAKTSNDTVALCHATLARVDTLSASPDVEELIRLSNELVELSALSGDDAQHLFGLIRLSSASARIGNFEAHDRLSEANAALLRKRSQRNEWFWRYSAISQLDAGVWIAWMGVFRAMVAGNWNDADALAVEGLEQARRDPRLLMIFGAQLFHRLREQGRTSELLPQVQRAVGENSAPVFIAALALVLSDTGELTESRTRFDALCTASEKGLPKDPTWTGAIAMLSELCAVFRDNARASALHTTFQNYSGQLVVVADASFCLGAVDRYLGMLETVLGRFDEAERHFESALALEQRIEAAPLIARTQYWYGQMLFQRHRPTDRDRAHDLLESCARTASQLRMVLLAQQAAQLRARRTRANGTLAE